MAARLSRLSFLAVRWKRLALSLSLPSPSTLSLSLLSSEPVSPRESLSLIFLQTYLEFGEDKKLSHRDYDDQLYHHFHSALWSLYLSLFSLAIFGETIVAPTLDGFVSEVIAVSVNGASLFRLSTLPDLNSGTSFLFSDWRVAMRFSVCLARKFRHLEIVLNSVARGFILNFRLILERVRGEVR